MGAGTTFKVKAYTDAVGRRRTFNIGRVLAMNTPCLDGSSTQNAVLRSLELQDGRAQRVAFRRTRLPRPVLRLLLVKRILQQFAQLHLDCHDWVEVCADDLLERLVVGGANLLDFPIHRHRGLH